MAAQPSDESPPEQLPPPDQAGIPTIQRAQGSDPHRTAIDDSRFPPGTLLAERYRIVGRIGKGGMGEVYRADDLKLGQSVALKFLAQAMAQDAVWLRRFHSEVRIAREIAHPNVCRVYDIGEFDGEHFITMEYIDGEDLATLLKRIGRLPKDKAIQIARQLCSGIAAAHDKSVLHRDLKPANIMLDGRGHVRITDFGIAALADRPDDHQVRAGTPAYMAPEQLAGQSVTRRSDIYSLGLVLYEIFTGREAFAADSEAQLKRLRESGPPTTPSSVVEDMDPVVERLILRCLANDPKDRPPSAIALAAALPGGDPLAAALAAGETPSPEMVAAAGDVGGLRPGAGLGLLLAIVVGLIVIAVFNDEVQLFRQIPLEKPPEVLADTARGIVKDLGHDEPARDSASGFSIKSGWLTHVERHHRSLTRWEDFLRPGFQPVLYFWYRESPGFLVPKESGGGLRLSPKGRRRPVSLSDPPPLAAGMTSVLLDPRGRLFSFERIPPRIVESDESPLEPDWSGLFAAAGLELASFAPLDSTMTPPVYCDRRAAWQGASSDAPEIPIRVAAGAHRGKPVYFEVFFGTEPGESETFRGFSGPWRDTRPHLPASITLTGTITVGKVLVMDLDATAFQIGYFALSMLLVLAGPLLLALRNLRLGRGDRKGAFRLATFFFLVQMLSWAFQAHHVSSADHEFDVLLSALPGALLGAGFAWIYYMALEPYVRRRRPDTLISWSRLLAGRFRDPLVGREILIGGLLGVAWTWAVQMVHLVPIWRGAPPPRPQAISVDNLLGARHLVGEICDALQVAIGVPMLFLAVLFVLRVALRWRWLALGVFFLFSSLALATLPSRFEDNMVITTPYDLLLGALAAAVLTVVFLRCGLVVLMSAVFVAAVLARYPITLDVSTWYAGATILALLTVGGLAVYGLWVSLAGRPLFKDELAEA